MRPQRASLSRRVRQSGGLLAATVLLCGPGLGWLTKTETREQLEKTAKVWKQPHNFRVVGSEFSVDTVSQGAEQWQVRATETNGTSALFAARDQGKEVSYGFNYDSSKSHWKPPLKTRVYASGISEGDDPEWTVRVEGPGSLPRKISVTGQGTKDVVYDAALVVDRPLKRGLFWSWAVDAKGRGGWTPWIRQGFGLQYAKHDLNAKFNVFQKRQATNSTVPLDWEGLLRGRLAGWSTKQGGKILSRDPQYTLRLSEAGLDGKIQANAKLGTSMGFNGHVAPDGQYEAEGFAEWNGRKEVYKGVVLGADAKATAKKGLVDIFPFGVTAVAALDKLKPSTFADGSTVGLRGRWKLGDRPAMTALFAVKPTKVPEVTAAGSLQMTQTQEVSGSLRLEAKNLKGMDGRYEMRKSHAKIEQAAELRSPSVDFGAGSKLRFTGKVYDGAEYGTKPRVQLGLQYEGKVNVLGKSLDLGGESAGFDTGRRLLDEMGHPWSSPEAQKAHNSATVIRRRVESDFGEARRFLEK